MSYGTDSRSATAYSSASPIPNVTAGGTWAGDASLGMGTVTGQAFGKTDWGSNHASASVSGYNKVTQNYSGQYVVGGTSWPMQVSSETASYATGHSVWEELYQIGGGTGTGQFTGTIHVDGSLAGTLGDGVASFNWALRTFADQTVASVTARFDAATNAWTKDVFSNGTWTHSFGSGALNVNEDVVASYGFTYGTALYLKSELTTSVLGNGSADFSNTVQFTGMLLPQEAAVFVYSGTRSAAYGITFAGTGAGTVCGDLACAVNAVPEPQSYALLLAGLGVVGWVASRRPR